MSNQVLSRQSLCSEQGSYLSFKAGGMHFALSAQHVRYITAQFESERKVHRPDGKQVKIFQFENQNVSCFEFADLIGVPSDASDKKALSELLRQRRQDHIDWLDALSDSLENGVAFSKATDPHKCAFGKWYDNYSGSGDEDFDELLANFDAPHKRLHRLGEELLAMEDRERALAILEEERSRTFHRLLDLFDEATRRLHEMQRRVAVILESGDQVFAIELDQIDDLVHFSRNELDSTRKICNELPINADIVRTFYHHKDSPLYLVVDLDQLTKEIV